MTLLDTNTVIYFATDHSKLDRDVISILQDETNLLYMSAESVREIIEIGISEAEGSPESKLSAAKAAGKKMSKSEREKLIAALEGEMKLAAKSLDVERAAILRDKIVELKKQ